LLFELSEKDKYAVYVARAITSNFYNLPENVRNKLIFELSDKYPEAVAIAVEINFNKLPENIRNELLLKLSEKNAAANVVASVVAVYFMKLPDNIKDVLGNRLKKQLRELINSVTYKFALHFIVNAPNLLDLEVKLEILNNLSVYCEDEELKIEAEKAIKTILTLQD
jgi:cation transport regulator ChaB